MRRAFLLALMISLLLLPGCGSESQWEEALEAKRTELAGYDSLSFTAELTADMGESVFRCTLDCRRSGGETVLTVVEPELARGVTARVKEGETVLAYDGLELSVGTLPDSALTPVGSVPVLLDALLEGFVTGCRRESTDSGELLAVQVYVDEDSYALLWLESESLRPVKAELVCGQRAVVSCRIEDFQGE